MPTFEVHTPRTVDEAVGLRTSLPESLYVAGGTDLLPNLKHQLRAPAHLVSLEHVEGLDAIEHLPDGALRLGATARLHRLATDPTLAREVPGLVRAIGSIAGPQHRRMGTLGGNVMLDTRCLFYNQTLAWRTALGFCLKADGTWCHVIGSAKACVAAQSSDSVPVLVALGAALEARLPDGALHTVPLQSLWTKDGRIEQNFTLPATALVTALVIPPRASGHRSTYRKVRSRAAVDFPQLGVAVVAAFDGAVLTALEVVLGAMLPHPKRIEHTDDVVGGPLDAVAIEKIAQHAYKQARPQPQLHGDVGWRRHLARVETRRALEEIAALR